MAWALVALACWATLAAGIAAAATPKTTLPAVESQVMCTVCGTPLNLAQGPEADRERAFIQQRIDAGETADQVKRDMVAQYGPAVLALPKAHGFNVAVYVVPPVALAAVAIALAVAVPRWRRRGQRPPSEAAGRAGDAGPAGPATDRPEAPEAASPQPGTAESRRLDEELARFDN
jgi:cytochrome c-type biogenesis protein CcmH/NrfF